MLGLLKGERRYTTLMSQFPEVAEELFAQAEKESKKRIALYQKLAETTIL